MDDTSPPPTRTPWFLSWPVLAFLFCLPGVLWSLASPLFSAPDEPSHAVKAVALWHGQVGGDDSMRDDGYLTTIYEIPAVWAQASSFRQCFAFQPDITADCSPPFAGSESISGADSTAGHYPPSFYALVGWGGRASAGPTGLYLMRITNAIACGLLLTMGVRALFRIIEPRLALVGVLVAVTPMVSFLTGAVNPNGIEICAAIAVWCTLLAILRIGDGAAPIPRVLAVQFAVAAAVVATVRPLSPLFLGAIGLLALSSASMATLRHVLRDRSVQVAAAVVVVVAALATLSILSSDIFAAVPGRIGVGSTNPGLVIVGETDGYIAEMIGVFGWLDTRSPAYTLYAWLAATFGLLALGLTTGSRRAAGSLLAVVGATLLLPVAAQYPGATTQGLAWQGRYTLPIAVGIPILAVVVLGDRRRERSADPAAPATGRPATGRPSIGRLAIGVAVLATSASVAAFFWTLRRYTTGATGSLRITTGAWQPPAGSLTLVLAMAAVAVATVAVVIGARPTRAEPAPRSADHLAG